MATKKFLDQAGTGYLWSKIKAQLDLKAAQADLEALQARVANVEAAGYDDTEIRGLITTNTTAIGTKAAQADLTALESEVDTLIGSDTNKSVRTIANEELAAQLITEDAQESLDTLQEIAAWIQSHPNDVTAINSAIAALQNKLTLGTFENNGEQQEYATVKAYVEASIANLEASQHSHTNKDALDTITAAKISGWDDAVTKAHIHENGTVLDGITSAKVSSWDDAAVKAHEHANSAALNSITTEKISNWDYIGADDTTSGTLRYRVKYLEGLHENADIYESITNAEIDSIIANNANSNIQDENGNTLQDENGEPITPDV